MNALSVNATNLAKDRRHDLDALRAVAMLLGILLHALMAFVPAGWIVQDSQAGNWSTYVVAAIHGFRMPMFFLISGFFTAMLWRNRGLNALITHRFKRVFLPLMMGMFTIVPAVWAVTILATTSNRSETKTTSVESASETSKFESSLGRPLLEAAMRGDAQGVTALIARGADVNVTDERGSTALHVASLFGHAEVAKTLLDSGADPGIVNADKSRPTDTLMAPWGLTKFYADLLHVQLDRDQVAAGREEIAHLLDITIEPRNSVATTGDGADLSGLAWLLLYLPVFHHLWFLWFLCWLVTGFVICVKIGSYLAIPNVPNGMILSEWRYAWLIPLTAIPQYFMTGFGPDTSLGLVPMPTVLLHYAIFFAVGVLYYDAGDTEHTVGKQWWLTLPFGLLVIFPVAMCLQEANLLNWHWAVALCSATYAWLVSFAMMGLFRQHVSAENKTLRYLSDSSYWLYLVHIPLIIYLQYLVKDWSLSAWLKLPLICLVTSGLLLLSYHWFVRYSWIGRMLNGPRQRPTAKTVAVACEG